jgi:RNA polymerase sigma-70 factor (ECF subfamily)
MCYQWVMGSTISMPFPARELTVRPAEGDASGSPALCSADVEARRIARAVTHGDEPAFRELYDRYHERLFRLAAVLGHGDESLAHEIVQSTMLTAARKLKPVESEAHLWNWLARVARQHLAKIWRQQQRTSELVDLTEFPETAAPEKSDSVLEENLDGALLELESEDRQAVEWFYFDGLSHKEIAERQGATPKAVSSRLERARTKLRLLINRRLRHES